MLKERGWVEPVLNSAADRTSTVSGPSGVKMTGPYDYVSPGILVPGQETAWEGAFGFNTETGPGGGCPGLGEHPANTAAPELVADR